MPAEHLLTLLDAALQEDAEPELGDQFDGKILVMVSLIVDDCSVQLTLMPSLGQFDDEYLERLRFFFDDTLLLAALDLVDRDNGKDAWHALY
jgi:hypothetical protein